MAQMAEAIADWQAPLSSAEVVSKVISPDSSNSTFFKNAEAAITEEFAEVRKGTEAAEEALVRTQQLYEDMKKRQEENNLILQRILQASVASISSQP
ncbi:hypothetical protein PVAP13_8KG154300 [Panicum virgatum]|uniref:Uncharacterized protein n=1 Tax=Panicum virgatum TaxID=38727 RepID=A0A8T0PKA6_PANVG|nr:hypothetical protein PVAP13_8KG154300 [Panicum virgatum]